MFFRHFGVVFDAVRGLSALRRGLRGYRRVPRTLLGSGQRVLTVLATTDEFYFV